MDKFQFILYIDGKSKKVSKDDVVDLLHSSNATIPPKNNDYAIKFKENISRIENKIPLYDIYHHDIYIVNKEDVYDKVTKNFFRLPNEQLLIELKDAYKKIKKIKTDNKNMVFFYHKLDKNIKFLENYDMNILEETYVKIFYYYSNEVGKNLTTCIRPSFIPYLNTSKPYYSRSELINMGLNMGVIKPSKTYYDVNKLFNLCKKVQSNDINIKTLFSHQIYIEENKGKYVVQDYTLYGSHFMNKYLRNINKTEFYDPYLEKSIIRLWNLIDNAPGFDKEYIIYRFIDNDDYISYMKSGDIFSDPGFTSCTRDPFYDAEDKFGLILIKIKLPKNKKGVGLCLETYSLFPNEQEIVLPPLSRLRLENKDSDFNYYHENQNKKVTKKYEFTYIDKEPIKIKKHQQNDKIEDISIIDFLNVEIKGDDILEKIDYFNKTYVNELNRIKISINDYIFSCNWYDSTSVYSDFFYIKTKNGYYMNIIDYTTGQTLLSIELNEIISVNYIFKYYDKSDNIVKDDLLLDIVSSIAFAFRIDTIIIHPYYKSCVEFRDIKHPKIKEPQYFDDTYNVNMKGADIITYCEDVYDYIKNKKKRFVNISGMVDNFHYFQLDKLNKTKALQILNKNDKDDIYQIYEKIFLEVSNSHTLNQFYIFILENFFYKISNVENKMYRLFPLKETNPFLNKYYTFSPYIYLFNQKKISFIPDSSTKASKLVLGDDYKNINNNQYRRTNYMRSQQ